jgi:hypothetical protein
MHTIISVGKLEGKKLLRRPKQLWEDNIKTGFKYGVGMSWIQLFQDMFHWHTFLNTTTMLWVR